MGSIQDTVGLTIKVENGKGMGFFFKFRQPKVKKFVSGIVAIHGRIQYSLM